jgi:CDP-diacylglycerol--serine O-phosphatidyltransferase
MEDNHSNGRKRPRGIYLLPNLFTTGAMFAGFYAIIASMGGRYSEAALAVFIAGVLDGLDGRVARLTGTQSDFGVQYDSLSDLVSFGMAPALVMYHWSLVGMRSDGPLAAKIGWGAAFLYVACAALRLARFNTQVGVVDKRWFIGLNSPSSAGLMMGFAWAFHDWGWYGTDLRFFAVGLTIACALMMVSRVRYTSFKGERKNERVPFWVMLLIVGFLGALLVDPPHVLFFAAATYAVSGPLYWLWNKLRRKEIAA